MASQSAVWREPGATKGTWDWYMYYSCRGKDGTLPGLRLATSRDGKTWTRQFNEQDPRGMGQIFVSTPNAYYEWRQISKVGGTLCGWVANLTREFLALLRELERSFLTGFTGFQAGINRISSPPAVGARRKSNLTGNHATPGPAPRLQSTPRCAPPSRGSRHAGSAVCP